MRAEPQQPGVLASYTGGEGGRPFLFRAGGTELSRLPTLECHEIWGLQLDVLAYAGVLVV